MNRSPTLLIVDDDSFTRRSLARTLDDPDYRIVQADSAERGLAILERTEVAVVISDFHMGEVDGAAFLEQVDIRFPKVVRVLLTSDTTTSVMVSAVNDGRARRVLYKPWIDHQIRALVRQYLGLPPRSAPKNPSVYTLRPMGSNTASRLKALLGIEIAED